MKWWWWTKKGEHQGVDVGHQDAKEAFAKALEDRQRAERSAAEVQPLMDQLRTRRRVNHFTELFEEALKGGKPNDR